VHSSGPRLRQILGTRLNREERREKDNIGLHPMEVGCEGVRWIGLGSAQ
jgi:hypothetical protein